jgi:hypothetical protein
VRMAVARRARWVALGGTKEGWGQQEWVVKMAARVVAPFIGMERQGGGQPGSDDGGAALSKWWPVMEGEARGMA